jgi:thymidylate synthase
MGDAHVYLDHVDSLKEQMLRTPRDFPTLEIKKSARIEELKARNASKEEIVETCLEDLEAFQWSDFTLHGYQPHGKIAMKMSV